jgi:hypothetical protein
MFVEVIPLQNAMMLVLPAPQQRSRLSQSGQVDRKRNYFIFISKRVRTNHRLLIILTEYHRDHTARFV